MKYRDGMGNYKPDLYKEVARETLTTTADEIVIAELPLYQYYIITVLIRPSGNVGAKLIFNNDDFDGLYTYTSAQNGAADNSQTEADRISLTISSGDAYHEYITIWVKANRGTGPQFFHWTTTSTNGIATGVVNRRVGAGAVCTHDIFTSMKIENTSGAGNFNTGSEVIVFGKN